LTFKGKLDALAKVMVEIRVILKTKIDSPKNKVGKGSNRLKIKIKTT
jgi:hypothetical protein